MADLAKAKPKPNIIEEFMIGAKKGFYLGVEMIAPAMILAYALIIFLEITGLMNLIGYRLGPVMALFGLPGEAMVALIAAFFAKAAGAATTASLYSKGVLTAVQATILFPACITMGTLVGHFMRIVIVSNVNKRWHGLLLCVPVFDAIIAMYITKIILSVMGIS